MNAQPIPSNPFASVADIALAQAAGGRSAQLKTNGSFPTSHLPVSPANLTAPTAAVVAVFALIGKVTGRFNFDFNLVFTDSAADTVTASVALFTGVTSVTGGTTVGAFTWESSAITVVGGAAIDIPTAYTAALPAGGLTQTMGLQGVAVAATPTTPIWLIMSVSATHNLSAMTLNAFAYEF